MKSEMAKVIVRQDEVVERLLIAILSRDHALLMGVPGLAKTLMVNSLSGANIARLQPHSVYTRPDAVRHHRHGYPAGDRRRPGGSSSL